MPTTTTIVQYIKTFRNTGNTVSNLMTPNETKLIWRDNVGANFGQAVNNNHSDNIKQEITKSNWVKLIDQESVWSLRNKDQEIRIQTR